LAALDLDCRTLTQYAFGTGITSLNQCFVEMHETVQASIHPDLLKLSEDPKLRMRLFPKLDPEKLAILIEKVEPLDQSIACTSIPRFDKDTLKKISKNLIGFKEKHSNEIKQPSVIIKK